MSTTAVEDAPSGLRRWFANLVQRGANLRLSRVERAMIGANGKALTMLVTALQARGHLKVEEFADTLAVFSVVVGEDDDLEGMLLAAWAGMMKESL